jgi:peptidoglycan biosynthesis protein MviN/MurJ (putative lipid II flippase)
MQWLSTVGLALASNIAVVCQAFYLQVHLRRRLPQLGFRAVGMSLGKILIATAAMGILVWAGTHILNETTMTARILDWLALVLLIPLAAAVYFLLAMWLRIEGLEEMRGLAQRVRSRLRGKLQ